MSRFQAGALVVYGNLGVHEVEAVGLRRFCDEPDREYYTLRPYFSNSHDRSYIPTAKEGALRPVTPAQQAAADLARIKAEELPIPAGVQPALAERVLREELAVSFGESQQEAGKRLLSVLS